MSPSPQDKDLRNGVCPPTALGLLPDMEIGHTRFSALQYRKRNSGFTPDRSLLLKQTGFMHPQRKRFFVFFVASDFQRTTFKRGRSRWLAATYNSNPERTLANSHAQEYSSFDQDEPEGGQQ